MTDGTQGAAAPGQAARTPGQAPEVYRRWCQVNQPANWTAPRDLVEAMWTEKTAAEQEFWRELDAAQERPAPGAQWHVVHNATGAMTGKPFSTQEDAEAVCDNLNEKAGRPGWFGVRPEPAGERPAPDLGTAWRLLDQARAERDQAMHRARELTQGILGVAEQLEQSGDTEAAVRLRALLDVTDDHQAAT